MWTNPCMQIPLINQDHILLHHEMSEAFQYALNVLKLFSFRTHFLLHSGFGGGAFSFIHPQIFSHSFQQISNSYAVDENMGIIQPFRNFLPSKGFKIKSSKVLILMALIDIGSTH